MTDRGIVPDTKDWTWVLREPCPECGFDARGVGRADLGPAIRANAEAWEDALARPSATTRPDPAVWSPLEYACHVRDVHRIFARRLGQMLTEDDPHFADWDQDGTAIEDRYGEQDPGAVAADLRSAAERVAGIYDDVSGEHWLRTGLRSDGSGFTVETLGRYHLHDVVHHAWDVRDAFPGTGRNQEMGTARG